MKRKEFLYSTFIIATIPVLSFGFKYFLDSPLDYPILLKEFCTEKELYSIGITYLNKNKNENNRKHLVALLKTDQYGVLYEGKDNINISRIIRDSIQKDFEIKNICFVNGWIISRTEARQCGLLTFI